MISLIGFVLIGISLLLFFIALGEDEDCTKSAMLGAFSGILLVFGGLLFYEGTNDNQQESVEATNSQSTDTPEKANMNVELKIGQQ